MTAEEKPGTRTFEQDRGSGKRQIPATQDEYRIGRLPTPQESIRSQKNVRSIAASKTEKQVCARSPRT